MLYRRSFITAGPPALLGLGTSAAALPSFSRKHGHEAELTGYSAFLADCLEALTRMCRALAVTQVHEKTSRDHGALVCPETDPHVHPLHTRAGEAVHPFAVAWSKTGKESFRQAALLLGDWLVRQQNPDGSWHETPEAWKGTTVDQCLSLCEAYRILGPAMSSSREQSWRVSIGKAAEWIAGGAGWSPAFSWSSPLVPTNYLPTAASALVMASRILDQERADWCEAAGSLVHETLHGPMRGVNPDGLVAGEMPWAVDMGYNYDQTLGYLALYSVLTDNDDLLDRVARLFENHVYFVYPDGSVDDSWGSRCYKWTAYGSKTAPGSQFLCALLANKDGCAITAGSKNLGYLRGCMREGRVGYGPHCWKHDLGFQPCNYPTFARATNLALALEYGPRPGRTRPRVLPAQKKWWYQQYPSINVAVVRTDRIMATVSAYRPPLSCVAAAVPQLSCPPRGGVITNLWAEGIGQVQSSSTSVYKREEPMHMPREHDPSPLTPRIEAAVNHVTYSSLFDFGGPLEVEKKDDHIKVSYSGRLRTRITSASTGISYKIVHIFSADRLKKSVTLQNPLKVPVTIVEPIVKGFPSSLSSDGKRRQ